MKTSEVVEMEGYDQEPWKVIDRDGVKYVSGMRGDLSIVISKYPRLGPGAFFGLVLHADSGETFNLARRPTIYVDGQLVGFAGRGIVSSMVVVGRPDNITARIAFDPAKPTPFVDALLKGKQLRCVAPTQGGDTLAWTFSLDDAPAMIMEALGISASATAAL